MFYKVEKKKILNYKCNYKFKNSDYPKPNAVNHIVFVLRSGGCSRNESNDLRFCIEL